jgi:hypothetical protein
MEYLPSRRLVLPSSSRDLGKQTFQLEWLAVARDSNPAPSEHEARVLTATSRWSVASNCMGRRRVRCFTYWGLDCGSDYVLDPVNRRLLGS